jgi:apolipoprotein D and lipocalin family protein
MSFTLGLATVLVAFALQQTPGAVRTVPAVNLDRYAGEWFEVARFPNRFQDQCTGEVRATYARRSDGRIDVTNRCRTAEGLDDAKGIARVVDTQTSAKLKVRFAPAYLSWLPSVWGDYWVIGLADDYAWAVVGSPDRKYLWILSRTATLDPASYQSALAAARANGFDVERLVTTRQ